jgi:hypothetical protein
MDWEDPLTVFAYGYGACYVVLACILASIFFSKKMVEYIVQKTKKRQEETSNK